MRFSADVVVTAAQGAEGSVFGQEFVLLDPPGRVLRGLNETGARAWQLCDGRRTVREIAQVIAREFAADPATVLADVLQFFEALGSRGLVAPSGAEARAVARPEGAP